MSGVRFPRKKQDCGRVMGAVAGTLCLAVIFGVAACSTAATPGSPAGPGTVRAVVTQATVPVTNVTPTAPRTPSPTATAEPTEAVPTFGAIDPSRQELVFWHVYTGDQEQLLLELVEQFNSTNEWGIRVVAEYGGDAGELMAKNLHAMALGTPPDLSIAYPQQVAAYAQADAVEPLDDYTNSPQYGLTAEEVADIHPAFLESVRNPVFNNQMLSFPLSRSMVVLNYNADWLNELGYETPPETWEAFREMSMVATDPDADTRGYALDVNAWSVANWLWSRGGDLMSPDGKAAVFNGPEAVEALTFVQALMDDGYAYQIAEPYGDQTDFANEKVLFTVDSTERLPQYTQAIADRATGEPRFNWAVAPLPHSSAEPVVVIYGPGVCVFKTTPQKQLASWLFVRWFVQTENNVKWAITGYDFPLRQSALESEELLAHVEENPNYGTAFGFLQWGRGEPPVSAYDTIRGLINEATMAVFTGQSTAQEALDFAVREANALLAE
jgi:ABC-type glycerol-3-phosphate transport system substrate-binding protein